jgi:hypothetical protein
MLHFLTQNPQSCFLIRVYPNDTFPALLAGSNPGKIAEIRFNQ